MKWPPKPRAPKLHRIVRFYTDDGIQVAQLERLPNGHLGCSRIDHPVAFQRLSWRWLWDNPNQILVEEALARKDARWDEQWQGDMRRGDLDYASD